MKRGSNSNEVRSPAVIDVASCGAGEKAATGDEELCPRQLLGPRVCFEQAGIAQCSLRIGSGQHRLDRISVEPQMVVADSAATEQLLTLSEQPREAFVL